MSGSNRINRRDFIKATTGAVGGIIGAVFGIPTIGYLIAPALREDKAGAPVVIGKLEDIPIGKFHPFSFTITKVNGWERTANNYGGYILRKSEDPQDILVLSSRCTHLSCTVNWKEEAQVFICPCHDAKFDKDGKVLDGPPPEPLGHFEYHVDADGVLTIIPVEKKSEA
ncbi:MAG: ubiquinol-cytochrome c reductase iron-sulfur subunit [Anaerolineales bacterium]